MSPTPRKPKAEAETNDDDALYTPTGCKEAYEKLEICLAQSDRDWRKCQKEVHALQQCNKAVQKNGA
ncbi:hypothetical protein ACKKBG_A08770 [Auxenochlorella protothecoides x Auxenochlorella symbiontica]